MSLILGPLSRQRYDIYVLACVLTNECSIMFISVSTSVYLSIICLKKHKFKLICPILIIPQVHSSLPPVLMSKNFFGGKKPHFYYL